MMRRLAAALLVSSALAACGASARAQTEVPASSPPAAAAGQPSAGPAPTRGQAPAAAATQVPNARDPSGGYGPAPTLTPTQGFNGQSNLVPVGFPTPNTWNERLRPAGPARDPGSLDWARPGP